ncbi:hypothetical protein ACFRCI_47720 [Streptomyces sp. NPDC056638]|uniref:hypothetical protein n=1 Tax=Streptomyces sp. NPDC056638 TaxID=3345887 RepID=UPI0036B281ED
MIRGLAYGFPSPGAQDSWNPRAFLLQELALDPVGVRVPALPKEQFDLPLGHHVADRQADRG